MRLSLFQVVTRNAYILMHLKEAVRLPCLNSNPKVAQPEAAEAN